MVENQENIRERFKKKYEFEWQTKACQPGCDRLETKASLSWRFPKREGQGFRGQRKR
jgi:hypothetical protein